MAAHWQPCGRSAGFRAQCTDYGNMQAWDTDWFMLQPLSILDKDSAAAVATTHSRGIPAAESLAALLGYRGARFPSAIEGRDATPTQRPMSV